jgi:aminopeptidase
MDERITRYARLLVDYSMGVQPEQLVVLQGTYLAEPLLLALYRRVLDVGGNPVLQVTLPDAPEVFFSVANDQQLTRLTSVDRLMADEADASLRIASEANTNALAGVDPDRQRIAQRARRDISRTVMERGGKGELRWCVALYPTHAYAQSAGMSLRDFEDFVYSACFVDRDDPVAAWKGLESRMQAMTRWLEGRREVHVTGPDTDLRLSIAGRTFVGADNPGQFNMPDGEIFTGPVEDSVEGMIRFSFPSIVHGREVEDIQLWFEGGRVVKATAARNQDYLERMLDADEGARRLGEFAFGANDGIQRFTKNILFDEKIGGTIHMAIGSGYPQTGSQNESAIHWDMICDLREGGLVTVDGEPFLRDGEYVV